ncbi:MAG: YcjF family protein [Cyanobacteriota bacterium]|nr:YcjF family protein [Cyanobacteriota bacterium]
MPALLPEPDATGGMGLARPNALAASLPRAGLTLLAGVVVAEALGGVLHTEPSLLLGVGAMATGWWWLRRSRHPHVGAPQQSLEQWRERCQGLLEQFAALEPGEAAQGRHQRRRSCVRELVALAQPRPLRIGLAGTRMPIGSCGTPLLEALRLPCGVTVLWGEALAAAPEQWHWPEAMVQCDALVYHLTLPLTAADLRWLEALPAALPLWLLVSGERVLAADRAIAELQSQWPRSEAERVLRWNGQAEGLAADLRPLADWLTREADALRRATPRRGLETLHQAWQAELEGLRRQQWRDLLGRTQWLVAAGVVAAPLPSVDLLVLTIANGLMLREMAALWCVPWSAEQLREAALELGRAALAFGVVEWSSQALLSAMRLHGATWLVGSAVSALSAAYLTRVIGRAMADVMALNAGVSSPDLERIRREAPLLISRAAEAETMDWPAFLQQGRQWFERQSSAGTTPTLNTAT